MKNTVQGLFGIMSSQMSRTMEILGMVCLLWAMPDAINPPFWNKLWFELDRGIEIIHPTQNSWVILFLCGSAGTLSCVYVGPEAGLLFKVCHFVTYPGHSWTPDFLMNFVWFFGFAFIIVMLWSVKMETHKPLTGARDHFCLKSLNLLEHKGGLVH